MTIRPKQQGFTIVELLIVIIVIGILATLVITSFTGIQEKARNSERQTDIKSLQGEIETYFGQNGNYPTLDNLNDSTWRAANLKGLDKEALRDPKNNSYNLVDTPASNVYAYHVRADDGTTACDNATTDCAKYTLTATLEGGGTFAKSNLN